ncbi:hypothetical protein ACIQPP_05320 [Streptomyces violaceusniger]|uniref:hypothetical protein n=1 Tax=Streptomyces violaceusniger TaxID=68280 RepID=UPI000996E6B9|nr:hypothetical protein [Streptomyces hygroscopicus]AQW55241.1 hypothetical protein SHXM_08704 [Streptomyces hygroscopicus]
MSYELYVPQAVSREHAMKAAAAALLDAVAERASRTPREAAEAAFYPGHPLGSVDAIEAEIIRRREAEPADAVQMPRAA